MQVRGGGVRVSRGQMSQDPGGRGDERPLRAQLRLRPLLQMFSGQARPWGPLHLQRGNMSAETQGEHTSSQGEADQEKLYEKL